MRAALNLFSTALRRAGDSADAYALVLVFRPDLQLHLDIEHWAAAYHAATFNASCAARHEYPFLGLEAAGAVGGGGAAFGSCTKEGTLLGWTPPSEQLAFDRFNFISRCPPDQMNNSFAASASGELLSMCVNDLVQTMPGALFDTWSDAVVGQPGCFQNMPHAKHARRVTGHQMCYQHARRAMPAAPGFLTGWMGIGKESNWGVHNPLLRFAIAGSTRIAVLKRAGVFEPNNVFNGAGTHNRTIGLPGVEQSYARSEERSEGRVS